MKIQIKILLPERDVRSVIEFPFSTAATLHNKNSINIQIKYKHNKA